MELSAVRPLPRAAKRRRGRRPAAAPNGPRDEGSSFAIERSPATWKEKRRSSPDVTGRDRRRNELAGRFCSGLRCASTKSASWHRQKGQRMSIEKIDTLVVGGGQAGLAASEHLSANGVPHLVLERHRIAERWRSERWDSLVANGPAWHDRFPGLEFSDVDPGVGPNDFPPKETVADYFVAYARKISAPIRCGVEVLSVERKLGSPGFRVETSAGTLEADRIVAATGAFQRPVMPGMVPAEAHVLQMHSAQYRNPAQLPEGAVLVVGSGSSGTQIAEELLESGRRVYLSVGPHDRPPRAYRGRDYCWWLGVLGKWDAVAREAGKEHVTIAVSGAHGGHTIDFRLLAAKGMILVGRTEAYQNGVISFASDLV